MSDALISIKPKYVDRFLNGQKAVEIRTRKVNLQNNARLWIYSTLPKASIQTVAYVKHVETDIPNVIWNKYRESIGISRRTFNEYVNGSRQISAIVTKGIWKLPLEISLQKIRKEVPKFHPPQFLKFMKEDDPLFTAIINLIAEELKTILMNEQDIRLLFN
jgi:predicted transcriptional regulator